MSEKEEGGDSRVMYQQKQRTWRGPQLS